MSGPRVRPTHCLTPQEAAIIDLWEAGHGSDEIIRRTGYKAHIVCRVLGYMAVKPVDYWQRPAAEASAALAARIREVHGVMA